MTFHIPGLNRAARVVAAFGVVACLAVLAGCGSSSSSDNAKTGSTSSTAKRPAHKPATTTQTTTSTHKPKRHKATKHKTKRTTSTAATTTSDSGGGTSSSGGSSSSSASTHHSSSSTHHTSQPKPKPPAHLMASFTAPNHNPKAGGHWVITITARSSNGGAAPGAKVSYQFLLQGQVVSRQPCQPAGQYTCKFNRAGIFHDDILWPARSEGIQLTFRALLTTSLGNRNFDWAVKVRK